MSAVKTLRNRRLTDYPFSLEYRLRWTDNDMYQHVNNAKYNELYDSVVNAFLIKHCGLRPHDSPQYGMVVHSHNDYFSSIAFPATAHLGLRVNKLGRTSVTYEIALFEKNVDEVKAVGEFVQVFVDRATGRPSVNGLESTLRCGLEHLIAKGEKSRL
jgi:acyl-CoA thioester hydrolase